MKDIETEFPKNRPDQRNAGHDVFGRRGGRSRSGLKVERVTFVAFGGLLNAAVRDRVISYRRAMTWLPHLHLRLHRARSEAGVPRRDES